MRRLISDTAFFVLLPLWLLVCAAHAQYNSFPSGVFGGHAARDPAVGGGCSDTNGNAFILRLTSGYGNANSAAYCTYFTALTTHSLFSLFDVLEVWCTDSSADAGLNLVSSVNYQGTPNGSPSFAAGSNAGGNPTGGYTGVDSSATVWWDTGFNPSTAGSPKFLLDSAHVMVWSFTNSASGVGGGAAIGVIDNSVANHITRIYPKYNDGSTYSDANSVSAAAGVSTANSQGMYLVNRDGAATVEHYKDASNIASTAEVHAAAVASGDVYVLALNSVGVAPQFGSGLQIGAFSIGGKMTSTNVTNLYNDTCALIKSLTGATSCF
jgi:hypothetical protein